MDKGVVEKRLDLAIGNLCDQDRYLLEIDAHERTMTHRIGLYLQELFPCWHVDCEYNRDGHDPKMIQLDESGFSDKDSSVYPDIIVHKRGCKGPNLLVIEAKKTGNSGRKRDLRKLRGYKRRLGYLYAVFLEVSTGKGHTSPTICWI